MSPSSSIPTSDNIRKTAHSRNASTTTAPPDVRPSKTDSPYSQPTRSKSNVHYTCFIRLPFPRNGFEDPPPVEWDTTKDRALWKLISKASNSKDLDWEEIATRFDVGLPFLLQQAAWLYERHFESMRKQMQKLGVSQAPSPVPTTDSAAGSGVGTPAVGGVSMQRQGSKDSRLPSGINTLKGAPAAAGEGSSPGTPKSTQPGISRTPSTTTVTQSKVLASSGKQPIQRAFRSSSGSQQKRPPAPSRPAGAQQREDDEYALGHDGPSDSASEDEEPPSRSQALRRPPIGKKPALRSFSTDADAEDDEDDSPGGFLPFAATLKSTKDDPSATLRSSPRKQHATPVPSSTAPGKSARKEDFDSSSSASSAQQPAPSSDSNASHPSPSDTRPGPLSPRHRAQIANANLSPRSNRNGSEGSPSMGSSFSDLDDASVTQSALEEALLSNMQRGNLSSLGSVGGMASRVGWGGLRGPTRKG